MKNLYIIAPIIAALALGACGSSDSPAYDNSLVPANATKPVTPVTIADTLLSDTAKTTAAINTAPVVTQSQALPAKNNVTISTTPAVAQSQAVTTKITAGLNPAHGQPGHRCDITVGAPLNSPVQNTASPQVQSSPVTTTPVIQQQATGQKAPSIGNSTGKINPPHGQPGHDCAVQVGAPLKN